MWRHVARHGEAREREEAAAALGRLRVPVAWACPSLITRADRNCKALRKVRRIFDAAHRETVPGRLVLAEAFEDDPDLEAREAFEACGTTLDLLATAFHRNSIDNRGMTIDATVHYGYHYPNAYWNGRQMIFGDGDGKLFTRFTADIEIVAHEMGHAMIQNCTRLPYRGEPGALCEHLADVIGMMAKQFALGQTARESDWLIGSNLLGPGVKGAAIRSMRRPGKAYDDPVLGRDPQPSVMSDFRYSPEDNGGVHINSGIPNYAFALGSVMLDGYTWQLLGKVWYHVLTTRLLPDATFKSFANDTIAVAGQLFGEGSHVQETLILAWMCAGLDHRPIDRSTTIVSTLHEPVKLMLPPPLHADDESSDELAALDALEKRLGLPRIDFTNDDDDNNNDNDDSI